MEERIKYLFRQYLDNTCSKKEFEEFFAYIRESATNEEIRKLIKKVYDEAEKTDSSLTYVDESGNLVLPEPEWPHPNAPEQKPRKRLQFISIAVTCIIIMAGIIWITDKLGQNSADNSTHRAYTKKSTQRSEYKYLLLPDSTQVWLNAASIIEYPKYARKNKREVFLVGEAYFDVKHADKIPFIIHTGKISTTVLGTAFNIKAYPDRDNTIVSVSRGTVRVDYDNKEVAVLKEGQQVKVSNELNTIAEKKEAVNEPAAWQQGNLAYDDELFEDIIEDLERIYDVKIKIQEDTIRRLKVSTSFKREIGVEQALQVLGKLTDTELQQQNGIFIIK